MISAYMQGGSKTTSNASATLVCYANITISKISVPIELNANTTVAKSAAITIKIENNTIYTNTISYDITETGNRTAEFDLGYSISAGTTVTVQMTGIYVTANYGASTPYGIAGQIVVNNGGFAATITIDATNVWDITNDNNGYPCMPDYLPDESERNGWTDPKPLNSWKTGTANDGYPYTWGFTEIIAGNTGAYLISTDGLIPLMIYYNAGSNFIQLTFVKQN
jgi:hypothetical protein